MKVLVTGGGGFIGSHVVDGLLSHGHEVAVVDDLSIGRRDNLSPRARFYQVDIRDERALESVFSEFLPEVVNHHAAQINVRRAVIDPLLDADVNILGSLRLIVLSIKYGVRKFVYISSGGAIYGEPRYLPVDENHPINPLSPYGVTKHTVEHYLSLYHQNHGLRYTVLRYPNVYGPRQDPQGEAGVVAIFATQMLSGIRPTIFGDGTKTRDYVYVEDIVRANLLAIGDVGYGEAFNLGWGREVSDMEVFHAVQKAVGVAMRPVFGEKRPGEIERICLDSSKAKKLLGWSPEVKLEEGIPLAVGFYKSRFTK